MIDPDKILQIPAGVAQLARYGHTLRVKGGEFTRTGLDVHTTWQGLAGFYTAPESTTLLTATAPVKTRTAMVGRAFTTAGTALETYAHTTETIRRKLQTLRADAKTFVAAHQGHDWKTDPGLVAEHNQLLTGVDTQVAAWMAAQRLCANTINALYGGTQYVTDNGDTHHHRNEYGYTTAQLDAATRSGKGLPWGTPVEHDKPWWDDAMDLAGSYAKGIWVDGVWGTILGIGDLFGRSGTDAAQAGWKGLWEAAMFGAFPLAAVATIINQHTALPGLPKGTLWNDYQQMGKGLLAWDEWSRDPARAAGNVVYNAASILLGPKGTTTGAAVVVKIAEASGLDVRAAAALTWARTDLPDLPGTHHTSFEGIDTRINPTTTDQPSPTDNIPPPHTTPEGTRGIASADSDTTVTGASDELGGAPHPSTETPRIPRVDDPVIPRVDAPGGDTPAAPHTDDTPGNGAHTGDEPGTTPAAPGTMGDRVPVTVGARTGDGAADVPVTRESAPAGGVHVSDPVGGDLVTSRTGDPAGPGDIRGAQAPDAPTTGHTEPAPRTGGPADPGGIHDTPGGTHQPGTGHEPAAGGHEPVRDHHVTPGGDDHGTGGGHDEPTGGGHDPADPGTHGTSLEGQRDHVVTDTADPGSPITDIDRVHGGVLWEEKSATWAGNIQKWVEKQVTGKLDSYLRARQHLPGYENAPIGINMTTPGVEPGLRHAIENAVEQFRVSHPDVDVRLEFNE